MIKENQRTMNAILILTDVGIIALSLFVAWFLRFKTTIFGPLGGHLSVEAYALFLIVAIIPTYLFLYFTLGLYKPFRTHRTIFSEATQIVKANLVAFLLLIGILFIFDQPDFSRILLFLLAFFGMVFGIIERFIIRSILKNMRSQNKNLKHILVVGDNDLALKFASKINDNNYLGYKISGLLGDKEAPGNYIEGNRILGSFKDLDKVLAEHNFDRVVIAISLEYYVHIDELVESCENVGIKAEIIPDYYKYFPARPSVDMIEDLPIINIRYVPLDDAFNKAIKSVSDIVIALLAIIITSPIMIITAIAIKLTSKGPVIFKQKRIGYERKPFMMYKFRSMKVQNPGDEKKEWTVEEDPRRTKVGSFIRRNSIDELPQFFNVLKGEMSVVGPRPERPYFVEEFRKEIPKYMVKHQVRPGLTGWAQIHGYRGNTSIKKRVKYDIEYVENWHLGLDFGILIKTVLKKNSNAY